MKKSLYVTFNLKKVTLFISLGVFIIFTLFFFALGISAEKPEANLPTVILDAGHGGEDGGTQSKDGVLEKDINLKITLKLQSILEAKGFKIIMTRDSDCLIYDEDCGDTQRQKKASDLHNRMKIMKANPDAVFVSIHQNYFTESKYSGAQVFYSPLNEESKLLASKIQSSIVASLQNDNTRQIKECGSSVYLIHNALNTAVMVECGFLSNENESKNLCDDSYQTEMAQAIADGLINYLQN